MHIVAFITHALIMLSFFSHADMHAVPYFLELGHRSSRSCNPTFDFLTAFVFPNEYRLPKYTNLVTLSICVWDIQKAVQN